LIRSDIGSASPDSLRNANRIQFTIGTTRKPGVPAGSNRACAELSCRSCH
jgi:hypothetical protein